MVLKREGGPIYSLTIREIFRRFHGVEVGLYTVGPCEANPDNYPRGTVIGRYSSLYWTARAMNRAQPPDEELLHSMGTDSAAERPTATSPDRPRLVIGNDVFIGHNAIILPTVGQIGDGAFIGAGSVVQNAVPPYAVVTGNPARVVRYRFSKEKVQELIASQWWQKSLEELSPEMEKLRRPVEGEVVR
jgi:acetyltransferase-like isoleucine patch superfamily enzyme